MEYVILVDDKDNETGTMEKFQAHVEGLLHRAVSVFVFNSKGQLLLQQRADGKYHSPLLWTNTCCTHPRPGEPVFNAANRRLFEEMGLACDLKEAFTFIYKARLGHQMTEHEYDHVFTGITDQFPEPDSNEVAAWQYLDMDTIEQRIDKHPEQFTEWFKICIKDWRKELMR